MKMKCSNCGEELLQVPWGFSEYDIENLCRTCWYDIFDLTCDIY